MNISRKIVLTGAVTLGVFALGSAGAAAVANSLTIEDRTGLVQGLAPVTTGTTSPFPTATPANDKSDGPTGTTTVAPAPPINVDGGGADHHGAGEGAKHDLGDDGAGDGHVSGDGDTDTNRDGDSGHGTGVSGGTGGLGDSGSGTSVSGSTSGSGSSGKSGSSGGGGNGGGSGDTGAHH